MTVHKIAVLRQDGRLPCPFGLPVSTACKTVGEDIYRMVPLDLVERDEREHYAAANRKVYIHHRAGERCPFADKIVDDKPIVHCDFQEGGEGIQDSPIRPSPYYPRVFNGLANNAGGGISGLMAHPIHSYWQNMEAQQLFESMLTMYAADEEVDIRKTAADLEHIYKDFFGGK